MVETDKRRKSGHVTSVSSDSTKKIDTAEQKKSEKPKESKNKKELEEDTNELEARAGVSSVPTEERDVEEQEELFSEELMDEWVNRSGRAVDFDVSKLESGVERPMTQIRLERAMELTPTLMGDKKYAPSQGYESGTSYESKSVYSPAQETRAPVFDQAQSDFFRTPTIVAQPSQNPNQQNTQGFGSQQNQQENQAEEDRRKQNRRF